MVPYIYGTYDQCVSVCMYACMHVSFNNLHLYVCMCMYVCMYVCMYILIVYLHVQQARWLCKSRRIWWGKISCIISMYVCMYVCEWASAQVVPVLPSQSWRRHALWDGFENSPVTWGKKETILLFMNVNPYVCMYV